MKKYFLITYGCQMNKSDSERIAFVLEKTGLDRTSKIKEADLIAVNMCSVRQSAVDRTFGLLPKFEQLKKRNRRLKTVLTGCILKTDKKRFSEKFDLVFSIKDLPKIPCLLNSKYGIANTDEYLDIKPRYSNKFSAFVPISNGCNNFCAYCVVPFVRGPLVCREPKEIIKEVESLAKSNFKEIWLLGQNVNDYFLRVEGRKSKVVNFSKLLKIINRIPGDFWVRFTSSHPKDFSDELIETMAKCEKVTPYVNLPVQSGDDDILKKMNRPYTVEQYKKLVQKIRKAIHGVCLSTDVIVGFPGETKKQFENTVKLFKKIKFNMAYIAEYSPRKQTAAFKMKDDVSKQEKERRRKVLTEVLKQGTLENNKNYIGETVEVLVNESRMKNRESSILLGKTKTYKTVKILNSKFLIHNSNLIGQFVKVKIIDAWPWGLKGKLI